MASHTEKEGQQLDHINMNAIMQRGVHIHSLLTYIKTLEADNQKLRNDLHMQEAINFDLRQELNPDGRERD